MIRSIVRRVLRYVALEHGRCRGLWETYATPDQWEYAEWWRRYGGFYAMGEHVGIVVGAKFDNTALVRIGNNVVIAPATFFNHDGSVEVVRRAEGDGSQLDPGAVCVDIRDNVFIGEGALVKYGVRIGPNAIVGIGAVVTRDVPPNSVVAGNPATVIGSWSDYLAKLRQRTVGQPWTELLAKRTVAHDPAMEPELTRLRQSTFAQWDEDR